MYLAILTICFISGLAHGFYPFDFFARFKRQMPFCSNGVDRALAGCFADGTCGRDINGNVLTCETATRYCCPTSTTVVIPQITVMPNCDSGVQASAGCFNNNGCNLGMRCSVVTGQPIPYCCRVCPNNDTSTGFCTDNAQCTTVNTFCNIFMAGQGLCCPLTITSACPSGGTSFGACTATQTLQGTCTTDNTACTNGVCCPVCPNAATSTGLCPAGTCTTATDTCVNGICCPATATTTCPLGAASFGPCTTTCSIANTVCTSNVCCPTCPTGQTSGLCTAQNTCTTATHTCQNGICCPPSGTVPKTSPRKKF